MNLHLGTSDRDGVTVLSAHGEIDVATAPQLRQEIVEIASAGSGPLVIDLEGVDFLDSTGLGVLVSGLKRFRTLGSDVLLVLTKTRILRVFDITGLTQVFAILATVDEAVAAARAGREP
jgi:anti-sigma B factor antagonist